jgi:hypothetical protein
VQSAVDLDAAGSVRKAAVAEIDITWFGDADGGDASRRPLGWCPRVSVRWSASVNRPVEKLGNS